MAVIKFKSKNHAFRWTRKSLKPMLVGCILAEVSDLVHSYLPRVKLDSEGVLYDEEIENRLSEIVEYLLNKNESE